MLETEWVHSKAPLRPLSRFAPTLFDPSNARAQVRGPL